MRSTELAQLAGVTVKTLRHYLKTGLLAEPVRSENGYRDYDVFDLVRLLRIRRLSRLGLPLKRIKELLDGEGQRDSALDAVPNPEPRVEPADACGSVSPTAPGSARWPCDAPGREGVDPHVLDELDADLARQIAELQERRNLIATLRPHAEDFDLDAAFRRHLARLRRLGASDEFLEFERGNLMLVSALYPPENVKSVVTFYNMIAELGGIEHYVDVNERIFALAPDASEEEREEVVRHALDFAEPMLGKMSGREWLWEDERGDLLLCDFEEGQMNPAQNDVSQRIWDTLCERLAVAEDSASSPRSGNVMTRG